jgi:hypothetical protein
MNTQQTQVRDLLLVQRGLVFLDQVELHSKPIGPPNIHIVRGLELEFANIGYVLSSALEERLSNCDIAQLQTFLDTTTRPLLEHLGANYKHTPLFRKFPHDIPKDTRALWWKKVLIHFLQPPGQPCLFCGRVGATHVLNPCEHVVCSHCFDGSNYSACPSCERHVDMSSPFFLDSPVPNVSTKSTANRSKFKLLTLGQSLESEAHKAFVALCDRKQALSPNDRELLIAIVRAYLLKTLDWLPSKIPLRENIAVVFGTLLRECGPDSVLPNAGKYITTATDVLRLIAVFSGRDGSLQAETIYVKPSEKPPTSRYGQFFTKWLKTIVNPLFYDIANVRFAFQVKRFKVAKMSRPLRRGLLAMLESLDANSLTEDMLRHRSYWVWIGEFLHPTEYANRFPKVAAAFAVVRKYAPNGDRNPVFRSWNGQVEQLVASGDVDALLMKLRQRPGEFARKLDLVLRTAGADEKKLSQVWECFAPLVPVMATPVLLTLTRHLQARRTVAPVRIYWPKGPVAVLAIASDQRKPLATRTIQPFVETIRRELLSRFEAKEHFEVAIIDKALRSVIVPFNERTASKSAISLPRGSSVPIPVEKTLRLFLHWCQPEQGGFHTDLDLSVALYDSSWKLINVCSYYQLRAKSSTGQLIAQSSGDLRDAPWPEGAAEFVDLHCEHALASGIRYAVMVVNNYWGMPFDLLERAFAGLMIRDSVEGKHFDPQTVALKFAITGNNGVFAPLAIDLTDKTLLWLDVQSKGSLSMNSVATSNSALTTICPAMQDYFQSRQRPSMLELSILHAAARCKRVLLRLEDQSFQIFERRSHEDAYAFMVRITREPADSIASAVGNWDGASLAFLFRGDISLPEDSKRYVLFEEQTRSNTSASDWLS